MMNALKLWAVVLIVGILLCADSRLSAADPPSDCGCAAGKSGPNILANGDFTEMSGGSTVPAHWTTRFPDAWSRISLDGSQQMNAVQVNADPRLLATYGADLLSDAVPVLGNQRYRCSGYAVSTKPDLTVLVLAYGPVTRRVGGSAQTVDEPVRQIRKQMRSTGQWEQFTLDIDTQPAIGPDGASVAITSVRVMLWVHGEAGNGWFGNVRLEQQGSGSGGMHVARPDGGTVSTFDLKQAWSDATEAFRAGRGEQAADRATDLVDHAPGRGDFRALAARIMSHQSNWPQASMHAQWLLDHPSVDAWQRDWGMLAMAQVRRAAGDEQGAATLINQVAAHGASDAIRREAVALTPR